jgi:hypothetical protein
VGPAYGEWIDSYGVTWKLNEFGLPAYPIAGTGNRGGFGIASPGASSGAGQASSPESGAASQAGVAGAPSGGGPRSGAPGGGVGPAYGEWIDRFGITWKLDEFGNPDHPLHGLDGRPINSAPYGSGAGRSAAGEGGGVAGGGGGQRTGAAGGGVGPAYGEWIDQYGVVWKLDEFGNPDFILRGGGNRGGYGIPRSSSSSGGATPPSRSAPPPSVWEDHNIAGRTPIGSYRTPTPAAAAEMSRPVTDALDKLGTKFVTALERVANADQGQFSRRGGL